MIFGRYEVTGTREYRGHKHGEEFIARLDRGAEQRAISRGDIRFISTFEPTLEPGSYQLPKGWVTSQHST